jgi:hypothetical protein
MAAAQRKRLREGLAQVVGQRRCIVLLNGQQVAAGRQLGREVGVKVQ